MIRTKLSLFALFVTALSTSTTSLQAREKVVAYVPNWVDLQSFSGTIDYSKITHINIAFENPTNDQGDLSFHKKNEILIAKAHASGVKIWCRSAEGRRRATRRSRRATSICSPMPSVLISSRGSRPMSPITASTVSMLTSRGHRSTRTMVRSSATSLWP